MLIKRLAMTIIGVGTCSFSVGIFNLAAFGVDPFQCFAQGFFNIFSKHMQYGTFYIGLSIIMLIGILLWDKHYVGLATFINLFLTGYIVDYSYRILSSAFPELSIPYRAVALVIAVIIMCFGSSLYYTADLGVSVYDAISLILANKKIKIRGKILTFKVIRIISDLICVGLGTILGKIPGAGTVITAFFMGPLISFFNHRVTEPMLYGNNRK